MCFIYDFMKSLYLNVSLYLYRPYLTYILKNLNSLIYIAYDLQFKTILTGTLQNPKSVFFFWSST